MKRKILLLSILILATIFRFYGLNWDQGFHLHPDERAIIMTVVKLEFPANLNSFLSPDSPWNPHFFAYGSFPFYLLKFTGEILRIFNPFFAAYDLIGIAGRFTSAVFDLGTLVLVFYLGRKLSGTAVGYLSAFFYAISVLPIQLSHFYAVDTILTFFILAVLYRLILFYEKPSIKHALFTGIFLGLALATKTSALVLFVPIAAALIMSLRPRSAGGNLLFKSTASGTPKISPNPSLVKRGSEFSSSLVKRGSESVAPNIHGGGGISHFKKISLYSFLIGIAAFIVFAICSPYALIDFPEFWRQTIEQSQMTRSAFTFPYTLQYVGKIPYLYELKNIFFWGLGPLLATISFIGAIYLFYLTLFKKFVIPSEAEESHSTNLLKQHSGMRSLHALSLGRDDKRKTHERKRTQYLIIAIFFLAYFLIVGRFAIGFMRYMLPLYPMLCIFGALAAYKFLKFSKFNIKNRLALYALCLLLFILILIWPISFMRIYAFPNPRTTATLWINEFVPAGKVIAQEHWDDPVPIYGGQNYRIVTLPLYDPDTPEKWQNINRLLAQTDYIIIASNRLYTPLQKLTDCKSLPQDKCYTRTWEYYSNLFNGSLGFQKIAEFSLYPTIPFINLPIDDQGADESFTVYDHPKVMIFQRHLP